jgi:hypothetical protein
MKKRKYSIKRNVLYKIGGECNQGDTLLVKNIEKAILYFVKKITKDTTIKTIIQTHADFINSITYENISQKINLIDEACVSLIKDLIKYILKLLDTTCIEKVDESDLSELVLTSIKSLLKLFEISLPDLVEKAILKEKTRVEEMLENKQQATHKDTGNTSIRTDVSIDTNSIQSICDINNTDIINLIIDIFSNSKLHNAIQLNIDSINNNDTKTEMKVFVNIILQWIIFDYDTAIVPTIMKLINSSADDIIKNPNNLLTIISDNLCNMIVSMKNNTNPTTIPMLKTIYKLLKLNKHDKDIVIPENVTKIMSSKSCKNDILSSNPDNINLLRGLFSSYIINGKPDNSLIKNQLSSYCIFVLLPLIMSNVGDKLNNQFGSMYNKMTKRIGMDVFKNVPIASNSTQNSRIKRIANMFTWGSKPSTK